MNGNMKVMSEMLTELMPGQADPSDLELLQVRNVQHMSGEEREKWSARLSDDSMNWMGIHTMVRGEVAFSYEEDGCVTEGIISGGSSGV